MLASRKVFGLAVTEQGITVVEAGSTGGRRLMLHSAQLPFTAEVNLSSPDKLGKELKQVLRREGFGSSHCVVGLAAGFLASREKQLPAADTESMRNIVSIAAEREFASGSQDLVYDYSATPSPKGMNVLLVAAPRRIMEQLQTMAVAAKITLSAVTSSIAALAVATGAPVAGGGRLVLCLLPHAVELAAQSASSLQLVRRLAVRVDDAQQVAGLAHELRRVMALIPQQDDQPPREIFLWNACGLETAELESIGPLLGLETHLCSLMADMKLGSASASPAGEEFAPAAALALAQTPVLDFLHSRLAPPKKARVGRRAALAIAAALVLVAGGAFLWRDWTQTQEQVAQLELQVSSQKESTQQARELIDRVGFARTWYDQRPRFLDCLREITQAFPDEGKIWATNLQVKEDMQALLAGKSVNESAAMEVLDRLKVNPRLRDVKPQAIRAGSGTAKEVSFGVDLTFRGGK